MSGLVLSAVCISTTWTGAALALLAWRYLAPRPDPSKLTSWQIRQITDRRKSVAATFVVLVVLAWTLTILGWLMS